MPPKRADSARAGCRSMSRLVDARDDDFAHALGHIKPPSRFYMSQPRGAVHQHGQARHLKEAARLASGGGLMPRR